MSDKSESIPVLILEEVFKADEDKARLGTRRARSISLCSPLSKKRKFEVCPEKCCPRERSYSEILEIVKESDKLDKAFDFDSIEMKICKDCKKCCMNTVESQESCKQTLALDLLMKRKKPINRPPPIQIPVLLSSDSE